MPTKNKVKKREKAMIFELLGSLIGITVQVLFWAFIIIMPIWFIMSCIWGIEAHKGDKIYEELQEEYKKEYGYRPKTWAVIKQEMCVEIEKIKEEIKKERTNISNIRLDIKEYKLKIKEITGDKKSANMYKEFIKESENTILATERKIAQYKEQINEKQTYIKKHNEEWADTDTIIYTAFEEKHKKKYEEIEKLRAPLKAMCEAQGIKA